MASPVNKEEIFMTCILRVKAKGWEEAYSKVFDLFHGASKTSKCYDEDGKIEISGTVDEKKLMKVLSTRRIGKKLSLSSWHNGYCHSYLYMPEPKPKNPPGGYYGYHGYNGGGYYGGPPGGYFDDRYSYGNGGYGAYPEPRYPFRASEAPPDAAVDGKGIVHGGNALPAGLKPPATTEIAPKSGGVPPIQYCCSVM